MLLIEFNVNFTNGLNVLKYRHVDEKIWSVIHVDIETLNLLLQNYGINSTITIPGLIVYLFKYENISSSHHHRYYYEYHHLHTNDHHIFQGTLCALPLQTSTSNKT